MRAGGMGSSNSGRRRRRLDTAVLVPMALIRSGGQHTATSLLLQPSILSLKAQAFHCPGSGKINVSSLKHLALLGISHAVNSDIGID